LFIVAMLLRERLMRPGRAVALAALCAIGALLGAAVYPEAVQRLLSSDDGSTQARLLMIDQALLIVRQNPLLGVGLGGYVEAARDATPSSFSHVSPEFQEGVRKQVAHNKYLLTAAENGLAGLALFCL